MKKKKKIVGYIRTKKRNKASALRKLIGQTALFTSSPPKTSPLALAEIQLSVVYWESGMPSSSLSKFVALLTELKQAIHRGVKVTEFPLGFGVCT